MKTGRPTKWGKKGKLIGVTIPLEDYDKIKQEGLDPGMILHKALALAKPEAPKPVVVDITPKLLEHWDEFLDLVFTRTGSKSCPWGPNSPDLHKENGWWQLRFKVSVTNGTLRDKWRYLSHAHQKLKN